MKSEDLLTEVRDVLEDPDGDNWTDADLLRRANTAIRGLSRQQGALDENYHNVELRIDEGDWVKVGTQMWEFRLPMWCSRVIMVWRRGTLADSQYDHRSPYLVKDANGDIVPEALSAAIPPATRYQRGPGFLIEGQNSLRLVRQNNAIPLLVQVVKLPAMLHRGTIDYWNGTDKSFFWLEKDSTVTANDGRLETVAGAYTGSVWEFTRAEPGGQDFLTGELRHCVWSEREYVDSDVHGKVHFNADLPIVPAIGDTYDMHAEVHDEHLRYLILLVCRSAFLSRGQLDNAAAHKAELMEERQLFVSNITPRQLQEPKIIRSRTTRAGVPPFDNDADPRRGVSW